MSTRVARFWTFLWGAIIEYPIRLFELQIQKKLKVPNSASNSAEGGQLKSPFLKIRTTLMSSGLDKNGQLTHNQFHPTSSYRSVLFGHPTIMWTNYEWMLENCNVLSMVKIDRGRIQNQNRNKLFVENGQFSVVPSYNWYKWRVAFYALSFVV